MSPKYLWHLYVDVVMRLGKEGGACLPRPGPRSQALIPWEKPPVEDLPQGWVAVGSPKAPSMFAPICICIYIYMYISV